LESDYNFVLTLATVYFEAVCKVVSHSFRLSSYQKYLAFRDRIEAEIEVEVDFEVMIEVEVIGVEFIEVEVVVEFIVEVEVKVEVTKAESGFYSGESKIGSVFHLD
jgi:hypothetical protein